ncbi:MAG: hypothetical protein LBC38_03020 [Oscillospiraceae bacterium]|jgi:hypothetical protein|nr:hypothetical protein [Oscillospiraceae bacterium]
MDSIIRELVGIDRVAREKLNSVNALREEQQLEISREKAAIEDAIISKYRNEYEEFAAITEAERNARIDRLCAEHEASVARLRQLFDEHRSEWAEALFERVTQC